jgi:hypothetical protein
VSPTQPNTQKGSKANHFTQKQKFLHQSILTNFGFTSASIPVTLNDFENPSLARLCLGLPIIEGSIEHDMLLNVPFRSDHEFVPLFRPIPISVTAKQGTNAEGKVVGNAYKSIHCPETSVTPNRPFANHICIFCSNVPHLQQFKREREKRIVGMNVSRAHVDDHLDFLKQRLKESRLQNSKLRRKVQRDARAKLRLPDTLEQTLKVS